jgi:transcriptional regulator with XRE-family HTH domain
MDKNRFKKMREIAGHTQNSLAIKLDVSSSTVSMWERGDRDPDTAMLAKICDVLDCTADYLLGRTKFKQGDILSGAKLPDQLKGLDIQIEVIRKVASSGLNEKQIERALKLYKLYSENEPGDR